jgi:hypothetical protein
MRHIILTGMNVTKDDSTKREMKEILGFLKQNQLSENACALFYHFSFKAFSKWTT